MLSTQLIQLPLKTVIISVQPRNLLETPAFVMRNGVDFLCYFPKEDSWCKLGDIPSEFDNWKFDKFFPCDGRLCSPRVRNSLNMVSYSPYTKSWMRLPALQNRCLWKIFVRNQVEMYALVCDACVPCLRGRSLWIIDICDREDGLFISKYKPESHSWEDILSFPHFHPNVTVRDGFCIVASNHFIYFIGGAKFVERHGVENKYV